MPENKFLFTIPQEILKEAEEELVEAAKGSKELKDSFSHEGTGEKPELQDTAYFSKRYNQSERLKLAEKLRELHRKERQLKPEEVTELDVHIGEEKREEVTAVADTLSTDEVRKGLGMPPGKKGEKLKTRMIQTIEDDALLIKKRLMLSEFRVGQDKERKAFVEEQKRRSVAELSKDNDLLFIHTLDLKSPRDAR